MSDVQPRFRSQMESRALESLGSVMTTLCYRTSDLRSFDKSLFGPLCQCIANISADAIVVYSDKYNIALSTYALAGRSMRKHEDDVIRLVLTELKKIRQSADSSSLFHLPLVIPWGSDSVILAAPFPTGNDRADPLGDLSDSFSLVVFQKRHLPGNGEATSHDYEVWRRHLVFPVLSLVFLILRHRIRLFASFPPKVSRLYWDTAGGRTATPGKPAFEPPWIGRKSSEAGSTSKLLRQKSTSRLTATLSFDLRKSTFCMENTPPAKFARWMDDFVEILHQIAHQHGGVFDKFTGDGALVHFLADECREVYQKDPIECAVRCAVDFIQATRIHLPRLQQFLTHDSRLLGGSAGIDYASAHWDIDSRFHPVTVGKGVVNACRLGDGALAGRIRLTNRVYRRLPRWFRTAYEYVAVDFSSKEVVKNQEVTCWEWEPPKFGIQGDVEAVRRICDQIYSQRRRSDTRK